VTDAGRDRDDDPHATGDSVATCMPGAMSTAPPLEASGPDDAPHAPQLDAGARVGRFALIEPIGRGGMAEVWAAYDPILDRRIALKLLLPRLRDQTFLLREARAVARLAHANVVAVHDAGDIGGRVFIAMEYLPGGDLRGYLAEADRPWPEIVALFCEAGRGLAAAHRAGLVHRDFKAANVLLGRDRRIVVADFGLAGARDPRATESLGETISGGGVIGTPAYMAPEQHRGEACDARSDQFTFCASLWQALYQELPFPGDTAAAIGAAVLADRRRDPPAGSPVPRRIRCALERGMSIDPAARFASMDDLLAALGRPSRRRRVLVGIGIGAVLVGSAALAVASSSGGDPCGAGADRWERGLGADWAGRGERAFTATGLPYAGAAWAQTRRALDDYGTRWRGMHRAACEARQRGEQSPSLLDARMRCLDGALTAAAALGASAADADAGIVVRVHDAVASLPAIESCADVVSLSARVAPTPAQRPAVAALETRLVELDTRRVLRTLADAPGETRRAFDDAERVGYAPAIASASLIAAKAAMDAGDDAGVDRLLDRGVLAAIAGRDDSALARTASTRAWKLARRDAAYGEALRWGELSLEVAERVDGDPRMQAQVLKSIGRIELDAGHVDRARQYLERAMDVAEHGLGPDHPTVAMIAGEMADLFRLRREFDRAEAWATRELDTLRRALGPDHPTVGYAWFNSAMTAWDEGDLALAELRFRQAMAIFDRSLGRGHADRLRAVAYLAEVLEARGQPADALAILDGISGETAAAPPVIQADLLRAEAAGLSRLGRPGARAIAERALTIAEVGYGEDSADLVPFVTQVMEMRIRDGASGDAMRARAEALAAQADDAAAQKATIAKAYGDAMATRR
jgi:eukaryotic-like serine/threonine-protein kinase